MELKIKLLCKKDYIEDYIDYNIIFKKGIVYDGEIITYKDHVMLRIYLESYSLPFVFYITDITGFYKNFFEDYSLYFSNNDLRKKKLERLGNV